MDRSLAEVRVSWREGVYIEPEEGPGIWCDALHRRDVCFVSSAHVLKSLRPADSLLCSERSWRLYESLQDGAKKPGAGLVSPTGRPFQLGALRLELFPSGQLPGAASLWLRTQHGVEVVYAGAPNPCARPTVEAMQVRSAQVLIVHAPLAATEAALPSVEQAQCALYEQLRAAQVAGQICVVLCSALSTAPDLIHTLRTDPTLLLPASSLFAHAQIMQACAAYRRIGALPDHLPMTAAPLRRVTAALPDGAVVFWPLGAGLEPLRSLRTAVGASQIQEQASSLRMVLCSAWALLPGFVSSLSAQLAALGLPSLHPVAFPDSMDRAGLLRYVRDTGSRQVFLTAGAGEDVAAALAPALCEALGPPSQLRLF